MISSQIIKNSIEDLHSITRIHFLISDTEGSTVFSTWESDEQLQEAIRLFAVSQADSQEMRECHFFKIFDEETLTYILVAKGGGEDVYTMGRVAVSQIQRLIAACKDRFDRNSFIQNLLLDNLLLVDMYNKARKLGIIAEADRQVYVIEIQNEKDSDVMEVLRGMYDDDSRDFITAVDERSIVFVREIRTDEPEQSEIEIARTICDMMDTEAMTSVRVAYGTVVHDLQQISQSYKEARMALNVGKIFYTPRRIHAYSSLGIGRLIYQLPFNLCEMFMNEIFTESKPDSLDEETLTTIEKFFENNLNVSETARQLFVHRNTLVYRLEKLQKSTGLDIRRFDDALTFQIALMVSSYMKYMRMENLF